MENFGAAKSQNPTAIYWLMTATVEALDAQRVLAAPVRMDRGECRRGPSLEARNALEPTKAAKMELVASRIRGDVTEDIFQRHKVLVRTSTIGTHWVWFIRGEGSRRG